MLSEHQAAPSAVPAYIQSVARAIHAASDLIAYGWNKPDGNRPQISRAKLNANFATVLAIKQAEYKGEVRPLGGLLRKLNVNDIATALMNPAHTLYLRSRRSGRYMMMRIDLDAHNDENDIAAMKDFVQAKLPNWPIYWSAIGSKSGQGHIRLDRGNQINGKFRVGYRQMNRAVKAFYAALEVDALAAGFTTTKDKARVEVQGSFLGVSKMRRDEAGFPTHASVVDKKMGTAAKLPKITSAADAAAFKNAIVKIHDSAFVAMVERGETILAAREAKHTTHTSGPSHRVTGIITDVVMEKIRDSDTPTSTYFCCVGAIQLSDQTTLDAAIEGDVDAVSQLLEVAHDLYAKGSGSRHHDHRTCNRDVRMAQTMKKALAWFDPTRSGADEERESASRQIDRLAATFEAKIPASERLGTSPRALAVVYFSMMEDFAAGHYQIPHEWLRSRCRHYHARNNGTTVGDAVDLLIKYGFIKCTDASYATPIYLPGYLLNGDETKEEIRKKLKNRPQMMENNSGRPLTAADEKDRVSKCDKGYCRKYERGGVTLYYHDDAPAAGGGANIIAATSSFFIRNSTLGPAINPSVNPWGTTGPINWPMASEAATNANNHETTLLAG